MTRFRYYGDVYDVNRGFQYDGYWYYYAGVQLQYVHGDIHCSCFSIWRQHVHYDIGWRGCQVFLHFLRERELHG